MTHLQRILFIGLGGALGSIARYTVQAHFQERISTAFPYGTLTVNLTGCFFIGLLMTFLLKHEALSEGWRFFLVVGICGGYTTFSAFSWEVFQLFRGGYWNYSLTYITASVVGGLAGLWGGILLGRLF